MKTNESTEQFDKVVICAGIWSKNITSKIKENVPLEAERGYHLMYPELIHTIKRPISWQERGLYFTPMSNGLRTAGTVEFAGLSPKIKGMGPVKAIPKVLKQSGLKMNDIELIELNEAFASQSIAVINELKLNSDIINVNGGAIALGHPLGCS